MPEHHTQKPRTENCVESGLYRIGDDSLQSIVLDHVHKFVAHTAVLDCTLFGSNIHQAPGKRPSPNCRVILRLCAEHQRACPERALSVESGSVGDHGNYASQCWKIDRYNRACITVVQMQPEDCNWKLDAFEGMAIPKSVTRDGCANVANLPGDHTQPVASRYLSNRLQTPTESAFPEGAAHRPFGAGSHQCRHSSRQ